MFKPCVLCMNVDLRDVKTVLSGLLLHIHHLCRLAFFIWSRYDYLIFSIVLIRSKTSDSWIYEYWLMGAYLASRSPLPSRSSGLRHKLCDHLASAFAFIIVFSVVANSNYYITHKSVDEKVDPLARTAVVTHLFVK